MAPISHAERRSRMSSGVLLCLLVVSAAAPAADSGVQDPILARERLSLNAVCAKCHNLQIVMDTPKSLEDWQDTLQAMVDRGAKGTDAQFDDIMDFLHRTMTTINVNTADADELKTVLAIDDTAAGAVIRRRSVKKISDLADLKSIGGLDAAALDAKSRLIFF